MKTTRQLFGEKVVKAEKNYGFVDPNGNEFMVCTICRFKQKKLCFSASTTVHPHSTISTMGYLLYYHHDSMICP
jgi:hypothetical protein